MLEQHCDRALVLHDPSDEDAPRMVFGKLVVSDDFVMLRRMYYAKVHLPLQMLTSLPLSHLHILLALTHRRRLALSQVAWTGLFIGFNNACNLDHRTVGQKNKNKVPNEERERSRCQRDEQERPK